MGREGVEGRRFTQLTGIAVDPEGHLWSLEKGYEPPSGSGSIVKPGLQEFSAEGSYLGKIELPRGSEEGMLREASPITTATRSGLVKRRRIISRWSAFSVD